MAQEDVPSAYGCSRGTRSSFPLPARPERRRARRHSPGGLAPRERWAKLAKRTTAELHGHRSPNRPAPKRTAPRHPARVAQIVARLSRRTDQILVPCAAYTGQHRRPATPLERHPARSSRKCTQFGTHKGQWCQEGMGHWPGGFAWCRRAGPDCSSGSSSQLPGSRRRAGGVKLERPQPHSGEDERA